MRGISRKSSKDKMNNNDVTIVTTLRSHLDQPLIIQCNPRSTIQNNPIEKKLGFKPNEFDYQQKSAPESTTSRTILRYDYSMDDYKYMDLDMKAFNKQFKQLIKSTNFEQFSEELYKIDKFHIKANILEHNQKLRCVLIGIFLLLPFCVAACMIPSIKIQERYLGDLDLLVIIVTIGVGFQPLVLFLHYLQKYTERHIKIRHDQITKIVKNYNLKFFYREGLEMKAGNLSAWLDLSYYKPDARSSNITQLEMLSTKTASSSFRYSMTTAQENVIWND